jgi:hypothetical protein
MENGNWIAECAIDLLKSPIFDGHGARFMPAHEA